MCWCRHISGAWKHMWTWCSMLVPVYFARSDLVFVTEGIRDRPRPINTITTSHNDEQTGRNSIRFISYPLPVAPTMSRHFDQSFARCPMRTDRCKINWVKFNFIATQNISRFSVKYILWACSQSISAETCVFDIYCKIWSKWRDRNAFCPLKFGWRHCFFTWLHRRGQFSQKKKTTKLE